ncbi:MAG: hypothetical protein P8Y45_13200 [Exilibacterium sp.]
MRNATLANFLAGLTTTALLQGCLNDNPPIFSIEAAAKGIHAAALSSDGGFAAIGSVYHGGSLWRTNDGERLFNWNHRQSERTTILSLDFSPDGRWAMTADPHTLVLWDVNTGNPERFWSAPGEVLSIALSHNGRYALLGLSDHTAVLFNAVQGGVERSLHHRNRVRSVDLSEDGRFALTGSEDYTAVFWDLESGRALQRVTHEDDVQMVALSGDGTTALSTSKYDRALIWNTRNGKALGQIPLAAEKLRRGMRFTAARFNRDGSLLITGRPDQVVQLWNTGSIRELARWKLPKREAWKPTSAAVVAVSFSNTEGEFVAVASNGFIHRLKR